jgi:hypothetical protein
MHCSNARSASSRSLPRLLGSYSDRPDSDDRRRREAEAGGDRRGYGGRGARLARRRGWGRRRPGESWKRHGGETEASDDDGRRGARLAQSHGLFLAVGQCFRELVPTANHLQLRFLGHVWREAALWWLHLSYIAMHMLDSMSET